MTKLEIKVDDWCLVCPNMELETRSVLPVRYAEALTHKCKHQHFCQLVIEAYEATKDRCKTCYHYKPSEYGYNCTVMDWDASDNDYCSRWEAKDD